MFHLSVSMKKQKQKQQTTNKKQNKNKNKQKQKRINYIFQVRQNNSLITYLLGNFSLLFKTYWPKLVKK